MRKTIISLAALGGSVILAAASLPAQTPPRSAAASRWALGFGLGFMHTMGGIRTVWRDRIGEIEVSVGYFPSARLGVELTGILGLNAMTEDMKNHVAVYFPDAGKSGHQSSWGGIYQGILFGPKARFPVSRSGWTAEIGLGAGYHGDRELGISAKDYFPRWTFGWGVHGAAGATRRTRFGRWGFQVRYLHSRARVNDFYYDRVYGKESFDEIPPTYVDDQRLILVFIIGV